MKFMNKVVTLLFIGLLLSTTSMVTISAREIEELPEDNQQEQFGKTPLVECIGILWGLFETSPGIYRVYFYDRPYVENLRIPDWIVHELTLLAQDPYYHCICLYIIPTVNRVIKYTEIPPR